MSLSTCLLSCCALAVFCGALPTRRQFPMPDTSSIRPALVTGSSGVWEEAEEFDLDDDEEWLGESAASPSSIPVRQDYEYDDDASSKDDVDDVDRRDAEEEDEEDASRGNREFLFVPSTDTRLMLQDDDAEQTGLIKVRHTGKNSYTEVDRNSLDGSSKNDDDDQFEFTLGDDDDDDTDDDDLGKDDFVLEETKDTAEGRRRKDEDFVLEGTKEEQRPRKDDDDLNDDDDDDDVDDDVFDSPEEDSQVIYGDHVFLY